MARHNLVVLYGQVTKQPTIKKDENGKPIRGICAITVIRGNRDIGNSSDEDYVENAKLDCPIIMTSDPEKIAKMSTLKLYDMIEVWGVITTREVNKNTICTNCNHKNTAQGNIVFITPTYLGVRETGISSQEEGMKILRNNLEISNRVLVVGTLCRDPETYITDKGLQITQYQLAINRKFRVRDDAAENRTDFPWVKSYGSNAAGDAKHLKMGSVILIDGVIQTREIVRKTVCSECNEEYTWKDNAMEIVPYETEYLRDFVTDEEYEKNESEMTKKIIDNVFNA